VDTLIASNDGEAEEWEIKQLEALGLIPTINGVPAKTGDKFKAGDVLGTVPVYYPKSFQAQASAPIPAPRPATATFTVSQYRLDQYELSGLEMVVNGQPVTLGQTIRTGDVLSFRVKAQGWVKTGHKPFDPGTMTIVPIPCSVTVHPRDSRGWLTCSSCHEPNQYAEPPASGPFVCGSCRVSM
jgi:hypothetical protein